MTPGEIENLILWLDVLSTDPSGKARSVTMTIEEARKVVATMRLLQSIAREFHDREWEWEDQLK